MNTLRQPYPKINFNSISYPLIFKIILALQDNFTLPTPLSYPVN